MVLNPLKLKMQSAARSTSQNDQVVFFTEASLGRHAVPAALRDAGEEVAVQDKLFSLGMDDKLWLEAAGEKQRIVLTADPEIRQRKSEMARFLAFGVRAFVLADEGLSGQDMGEIFVKALPGIKETCAREKAA